MIDIALDYTKQNYLFDRKPKQFMQALQTPED